MAPCPCFVCRFIFCLSLIAAMAVLCRIVVVRACCQGLTQRASAMTDLHPAVDTTNHDARR